MRSSTEILISALDILSKDIYSEDGVANACIAEAADRLRELEAIRGQSLAVLEFMRDRLLENGFSRELWPSTFESIDDTIQTIIDAGGFE